MVGASDPTRRGAAAHGVRGGPASGGSVTAEAFGSLERDVGGAHGVAARDGGQALHVRAEQLGEGAGLGLAQLRELRGHMGDRAVVLAQLHAPVPAAADLADLRGVAPGGQHVRQGGDPGLRLPRPDDLRRGGAEQVVDALGGETVDGLLARVRGEEAQRGDGEVVVAVPEPGPAGVGEQVVPGRAAPAARAAPGCVAQLGLSRLDQRVQMPADRRRRQLQLGRDRRRGARPLLHQQPGDGGAGAALGMARLGTAAGTGVTATRAPAHGGRVQDGNRAAAFHNTSVTYIRMIGKADPPVRGGRVSGLTVGPGRYPADMSRVGLGTPPPATPALQVGAPEAGPSTIRDPARIPRRLGLTGALMMGIGALGAGALPVPNPLFGLRVISLPARNATAAIAITYAGMGMLVLAWLWIGRMLRARGAVAPAPDRTQLARTGLLWALPLALAPPMFSKDVYSYLAQSAITARGLDPYSLGPAAALGVDDPLTRTIPTIWRDTPAPYGPLFLMLGRGITALTGSDVIQGVYAHRVLALVRRGADHLGAAAAGPPLRPRRRPRALARRGEPAGAVPPGQRHPQRGPDDRARCSRASSWCCAPSTAGPAFLRDPRFVLGAVVVSLGAAVKLPGAPGAGLRRDGGGARARRTGARRRAWSRRCWARSRPRCSSCSASAAAWGSAGRARWAPRTSSAAGCRWRRTWASSRVRSGSSPVSATTPTPC